MEEKDLNSVKITCVFCGRRRKKGLSRSSLFCTKHCQTRWQECHPGETPSPGAQASYSKDLLGLLLEAFPSVYFPQIEMLVP